MRFRFRGLYRDTAKPIEGHIEAPEADSAYQLLSERGIVTEALQGDPDHDGPLHEPPREEPSHTPDVSMFENALEEALENALDSSSTKVSFDALTKRYRGKKVRVIDRDKIRERVAKLVDSTLADSEANRETGETARERVADAIHGLFQDSRNIATEHNAANLPNVTNMPGGNLAEQIGRLSGVVEQAEGLIAAMQSALRNVDSRSGPIGRNRVVTVASINCGGEQSAVLKEILQSNLDLRREIQNKKTNKSPNKPS